MKNVSEWFILMAIGGPMIGFFSVEKMYEIFDEEHSLASVIPDCIQLKKELNYWKKRT